MLPNQGPPMPPPPAAGPAGPGAPPAPTPTEGKEVIKQQLRQAYSELKALAASAGVDWSEIEVPGASPAGAGPMAAGPPPMLPG